MGDKYLFIPIGIALLLLYSITYVLSIQNICKTSNHRKIWNSLLLITFLVTGVLGIILVLQVNYKLSIPCITKILSWHVNFGIGMFFIVLFHTSWHIKYYMQLFKKKKEKDKSKKNKFTPQKDYYQIGIDSRNIRIALITLGFLTIAFQIIILREFITVFLGNELVLGILLCNWMLLTATGAYIGKLAPNLRKSDAFVSFSLQLLSILPFIILFLLYWLKNIVFHPGTMIGLVHVFLVSLVLLLPYCLISGFIFTMLSCMYSAAVNKKRIDRAYAFESLGSMLGGFLVSLVLVYFFDAFQILFMLFIIAGIVALYLNRKLRKKLIYISFSLVFMATLLLVYVFNINHISKQFLHINQELLFTRDTPYGNISITRKGNQIQIYENNVLSYYTNDIIENEEAVHYGMIQHDDPEHVLLISGDVAGMLPEVKKYNVQTIDFIEMNSWLVTYSKILHSSLSDTSLTFISGDPRLYIKQCTQKYDIVLINLPLPSTAQINRLFTEEFYTLLTSVMDKQSVLSIGFTSPMNYISEEISGMNSSLYNSLRSVFNHVIIIPGYRNYFIASDTLLHNDIVSQIEKKGIENEYVSPYYLDDYYLKQRSDFVMSSIDKNYTTNTDFHPLSYGLQVTLWFNQFSFDYKVPLIILCVLVIVIMVLLKPIQLGMFTTGFAGASYEVILLLSIQIVYGYVYAVAGIIITLFMAGLAIGASLSKRWKTINATGYGITQLIVGLFGVLIPIFVQSVSIAGNSVYIQSIFYLLTLFISILVGMQFAFATRIVKGDFAATAAGIYGIDLLGSAIGALLVSVLLIPLFGVINLSIFIGALCIVSAINTYLKRKKIEYNESARI